MSPISTHKTDKAEAWKVALDWLHNGIPQKGERVSVKKVSLWDLAKRDDLTQAGAEQILKELQRRGLLKTYVIADTLSCKIYPAGIRQNDRG